jgi:DNA-binding transcriptional MerR regulator
MTIDKDNLLDSIMESLDRIQYIKLEDIPNIDLYMDQVTTFMERKLKKTTRHQDEDKILTKTMINNYTKNNLLPPPERKKYTKDHILLLIFIYYYKGILSIQDIHTLLDPLKNDFFQTDGKMELGDIYEEIFALEKDQLEALKEDVIKKFEISQETFAGAAKENQEFLRLFSFISMLSFDVYIKRLLIEKMIDSMNIAESEKSHDKTTKETKK